MEVSDEEFMSNGDWDPSYLRRIFEPDFFDYSELWNNGMHVNDKDLVQHAEKVDPYIPIVEDISLDDGLLCDAVERIEEE